MRIRSVGHACLEITTRGLRIVSDPWWAGPAYNNQWYPWPQPRPDGLTDRAIDYLYLSHGHEDHLHLDTLGTLRQGATVLVPRFVTGRLGPFLREFGSFSEVIELDHGRSIVLRNGVRATCYINATDSLLVLEGDETVVNANDALHASPPAVIEHFCRLLRRRHPRINAMFIGYGGAAWSPNCIHVPGKDDREIARAQEGLFVQNFLRIVDRLAPQVACAFAASFVLLEPWNRWINDVKLSVPTPDVAYGHETVPGRTRCHLLLPNDVVEGGIIRPGGTPPPLDRGARTSICDDLPGRLSTRREPRPAAIGRARGSGAADGATAEGQSNPDAARIHCRPGGLAAGESGNGASHRGGAATYRRHGRGDVGCSAQSRSSGRGSPRDPGSGLRDGVRLHRIWSHRLARRPGAAPDGSGGDPAAERSRRWTPRDRQRLGR
jgi:hypothetical protein